MRRVLKSADWLVIATRKRHAMRGERERLAHKIRDLYLASPLGKVPDSLAKERPSCE